MSAPKKAVRRTTWAWKRGSLRLSHALAVHSRSGRAGCRAGVESADLAAGKVVATAPHVIARVFGIRSRRLRRQLPKPPPSHHGSRIPGIPDTADPHG